MKTLISALVLLFLLAPKSLLSDELRDIQSQGVVRIGICQFAPWSFINTNGDLEGFEVDVAKQIALDMGVQPMFVSYSLEDIFAALEAGDIDFAAAGLAITPERALLVDFSSPYTFSGISYLVNKTVTPKVKSVEDLNEEGRIIVSVSDTFSSRYADALFDLATVRMMPDDQSAEEELLIGKAHGYLTSLPEAQLLLRKHPKVLDMPNEDPLVGSVSGFAVRRGNQSLLNYLNAWVASRNADRWLHRTYAYWFSNFDWLDRVEK